MTTISNGKKLGIYVHIPFCVRKCAYCDFLSLENESALIHKVYIKALLKEISSFSLVYGDSFAVDSIFIGGGTPTIILPSMIDEVIQAIKSCFNVEDDAEITIEANPKTLSMAKLEVYLDSGINRISIGAQSFNDYILRILGRIHLAEDIKKNYDMARACGFKNINLDLIFGIPAQSLGLWQETLASALELEPEHISFYSLQIEEGTKFHKMSLDGTLEKVTDETDRKMYQQTLKTLTGAGYVHYEISNAAKAGYECNHNIKYWTMSDYLGVGLGAHSYVEGKRFSNIRDIEGYVAANLENGGELPDYVKLWESSHENKISDNMSEYMFTGLRMTKGIGLSDFEDRFKLSLQTAYANEWQVIDKYIKRGLLIMEGDRLKLSLKGIDISNKIMSEFMISEEG